MKKMVIVFFRIWKDQNTPILTDKKKKIVSKSKEVESCVMFGDDSDQASFAESKD